jgi:hypothetical protein
MIVGPKVPPQLEEAAMIAARLAWRMGNGLGLTPTGHLKLGLLEATNEPQ